MSSTNLYYLMCMMMLLSYSEAYKILVVIAYPVRSHANLGDGVVRHLLKDGHDVTYISAFPYKPAHPNLRKIDISAVAKAIPGKFYNLSHLMRNQFDDYYAVIGKMIGIHKMVFELEDVQKLLNDPGEQFDAVISLWLFTELPAGLAAIFSCPLIWISSNGVHWSVQNLIDGPSSPAYAGHVMSPNLPPFNLWQRAEELYHQLGVQIWKNIYYDIIEKEIFEEIFAPIIVKRGRQPPSYYDVQFNTSLVLGNSHQSLGQANPVPQNYIHVGGFYINEEVLPLPDDLQKIMDNAKNGVIYFSMGTNLKSRDIPQAIKNDLVKMFGEINQTVLWKYEEDLPNLPKNLHILKWAPQLSILSHPNTVLFITHGGYLSTTETVHFGVPIIGIPVFGDQFQNIDKAVKSGIARRVQLGYTMVEELKSAIIEVTTNPRYSEKVKELSFIYHDRPVPPGKELVHWVRHVIRTRGAPLLRSPGFNVPFYQKLYLDLLALVLVVVFVIVRLIKNVVRSSDNSIIIVDTKKKI